MRKTPRSLLAMTNRVILSAAVFTTALVAGCSDPAPKPKAPVPVGSRPSPTSTPGPGPNQQAMPRAPVTPPAPAATPPAGPSSAAPAGAIPAAMTLSGADSNPTRIEIAGLVMPKPVTWIWQKPTMQFRTLQYAVPAPGGSSPDAELIFSLFPAGDGGPIEPNIERWANQFRVEGGGGAKPENRTTRQIDGMRATRLDLRGAYMGMGAAAPRPNMAQLGAIIESPDATVFIRLLGPEATVETARKDFEALVDGMKRANAAAPAVPAAPAAPIAPAPPAK